MEDILYILITQKSFLTSSLKSLKFKFLLVKTK